MIKLNIDKLHHLFEAYKQHFVANFVNERYKWIAAEHFQRNWDIDAFDFTAMLLSAMAKTDNLQASNHHFPLGMLQRFCETDVEEVGRMFRNLYDETLLLISKRFTRTIA